MSIIVDHLGSTKAHYQLEQLTLFDYHSSNVIMIMATVLHAREGGY